MQPDPAIYLRGLRRELLRAAEERSAGGDQLRAFAYLRSAEAALQMIERDEHGAARARAFMPRLQVLLQQTVIAMRQHAVPVPDTANDALQPHADIEAAALQRYDALGFALADCIAALSRQANTPEARAVAEKTGSDVIALEQEWRSAHMAAAQSIAAEAPPAADIAEQPLDDSIVTAYLRERVPQYPAIRASNVRRRIGFNTKEIWLFEISSHPDWPNQAVLRRNRPVDSVGNSVAEEFELLEFLYRAGIAVPRPLLADSDHRIIERSFVISERKAGQALTLSSMSPGSVAVAQEMAERLGALHRLDPSGLPASRLLYRGDARERTLAMVDRFYRLMRASWYEPALTHEAAFAWLRANVDRIGPETVIVHGDYDCRNILFEGDRLSAVLDWELAHLGHPAEDLAYCRPQIVQVMDWKEFLAIYRAHGGKAVREEEVAYFEIYNDAFRVATMQSATHNYLLGRHDDILIGMAGLIEQPEHLNRITQLLSKQRRSR